MRVVDAVTAVGAVVVVGVALTAGPAWAHEEITPGTVSTGKPTFLTLRAANEQSSRVVRVTLRPPAGVTLGAATQQPPGWAAERSPSAITWTGGQVESGSFGEWGFEIEPVGQPGPLRFTVELGFADGSTDESQVEIVAEGARVVTEAPTTSAAPATTTVPPTEMDHSFESDSDSSEGLATAALVIAVLSAVLSLVAVALAARRRPAVATGSPPSETRAKEQDW